MALHFYTARSIKEIKEGYLHCRTTWYLGWTLDVRWPTAAMFRKKKKTRRTGQAIGQVGDKIHLRWRRQDGRVTEMLRKVILLWGGAARLNVSSAWDSEDGSWIKHEDERYERLSRGGRPWDVDVEVNLIQDTGDKLVLSYEIKFHWGFRSL